MEKNRPDKKFKIGAVNVVIWKNKTEKGDFSSVQIDRAYKGKDNLWKNTSSLRVEDIPKAVLALNKAYEYLMVKEQGNVGEKIVY